MDHLTIREAYGHGLPLGIDAQIPQQILDLELARNRQNEGSRDGVDHSPGWSDARRRRCKLEGKKLD